MRPAAISLGLGFLCLVVGVWEIVERVRERAWTRGYEDGQDDAEPAEVAK